MKPLNEKKPRNYFSLLCDGSSSATTSDEKEVYLIKTCKNGKTSFDVLSLQQPDDTSALRLHLNLKDSVRSASFSFEKIEHMVGLGSDETNANKRLYKLEKEDTQLEKDAQLQLENDYYIFKKVTLTWRLFKCYGEILGQRAFCYKRPEGTRWVSHQITALDVHLNNLKVVFTFSNELVEVPYNATMRKEMKKRLKISKERQAI